MGILGGLNVMMLGILVDQEMRHPEDHQIGHENQNVPKNNRTTNTHCLGGGFALSAPFLCTILCAIRMTPMDIYQGAAMPLGSAWPNRKAIPSKHISPEHTCT